MKVVGFKPSNVRMQDDIHSRIKLQLVITKLLISHANIGSVLYQKDDTLSSALQSGTRMSLLRAE